MSTENNIPNEPLALHNYVLERLLDNETPIIDPTNPYTMLLESNILVAQQLNKELELHMHKYFPGIARDMHDLSYHLTNMDETNLFNSPAKAIFRFYIELNNFLSNAIYIKNDKRYMATIPKYTSVEVDGITFTLLAPVKINIIDNNGIFTSFIEHVIDDSVIDLKNIGNLPSFITKDENNVDWLIFDLPLLQLLVSGYTVPVTKSIDFDIKLPLKDNYNNSIVETIKNDSKIKLENIYVESKYDIDIPSIYIKINNEDINFKIPKYYIDNGMIGNSVDILLFTTKGKLNMRLSDYDRDMFNLKYGPTNDIYEEAMNRITTIVDSHYIVNSGTNNITFRELKNKIIYRTNNISIPITERQLIEYGRKLGFTIFKDEDTIFNRLYLSTTTPYGKDIINSTNINTTFLTIKTYIKYMEDLQDGVLYNDDYIIIEKDTVFKDNNNIVKMLAKSELDRINKLPQAEARDYINSNELYFSPYRYIFDLSRDIIDFRAYDIEYYMIDKLEIKVKNKEVIENVNVVNTNIFRKGNKYYLFFKLFGNEEYELIKNDIRLQLKIPTSVINDYIYLHSILDLDKTKEFYPDADEPYHLVEIDTEQYIDQFNNIKVINSYKTTLNSDINIFSIVELSIYTERLDIINNNNITALNLNRGNIIKDTVINAITFTIETFELTLAKELKYINNKVIAIENNRIFTKYETDIYERYTTNTYKIDPTTGCEITIKKDENGECINVTQEQIHNSGDYVLDEDGNKILKHKKGDVILNNEGKPVINKIEGIELISKLLLLDYKFKFVNKDIYNTNIKKTIEYLTNIITNNLEELNKVTLDNTIIRYASRYSNEPIKLNNKYVEECVISPIVNIYTDEINSNLLILDNLLLNKIGNIITAYLNKKYFSIDNIENEIQEQLKYATNVQLLNVTKSNLKTISIENNINRFRLKTKLTSTMDVVYDIKVNIITI